MIEKVKQLRIMTFAVGCVVIVLSAFLCGCESKIKDDAGGKKDDADGGAIVASARTFSSDLHLKVYVMREAGGGREQIGTAPSDRPINIPHGVSWAVEPIGQIDMNALAREIATKKIPGLHLKRSMRDADLAHLKGLTGLQTLNLRRTDITNAGLAHLKGLTGLQTLSLWDTKVTDAGTNSLRKALPEADIH